MALATVRVVAAEGMQWSASHGLGGVDEAPAAEMAPDEDALFATDEGMMYVFKVLPCPKRTPHEWAGCPYAHPGEKARRRCPRTTKYSANPCGDTKQVITKFSTV